MLEGLLKGLVLWLYSLILDGVNFMANALLDVFNMDLSYFEEYAPVTSEIVQIIIAAGWALLIGNLVFQAMRSMAAGIGFEGEDPKILFTRTFVFGFLLVASRQVCEIGLSITSTVMNLMQVPDSVVINTPDESMLGPFDAAWIWMVIIGIILIWQIVKFFFEIGERYVVLAVLTIMAPLAFGMGGSKSTEDIFKGWVRMYGSMCVMMLMNVVFLKLLLSAMSTVPSGLGLIPWLIFVVAVARVGRKVDDLVCRVGLNPARTGDPLGRGIPVMVSMMVAKNLGKTLAGTFAANKQGPKPAGGAAGAASGSPRPGPAGPAGSPGGSGGSSGTQRRATGGGTYFSRSSAQTQQTAAATAAMGGVGAAAGQAAHAAGQAAGNLSGVHHQPQDHATRQERPAQDGQPGQAQSGKRPGARIPQQPSGQPRTRPVNLDVEYEEPAAHTSGATMPSTAQSPSASPAAAKAAEPKPNRPPIARTPRGNFPQAPVGAGAVPHSSHSSQTSAQTSSSSTSSQSTQVSQGADRPVVPRGAAQTSGIPGTQPAAKPAQPPLSGARSTGAGIDRSTPPTGGATRPPIGHNAAVTQHSQESRPPSPGRNAAPAGAASPGRDTATHSVSSVVQSSAPSPGRNGAPAPQKPLPPTQGTDRTHSPAPSPGRNSTPQGAPPSPRRESDTGSERTGATAPPPSPGKNAAPAGAAASLGREAPQRPPIGHKRKPPQGSE